MTSDEDIRLIQEWYDFGDLSGHQLHMARRYADLALAMVATVPDGQYRTKALDHLRSAQRLCIRAVKGYREGEDGG